MGDTEDKFCLLLPVSTLSMAVILHSHCKIYCVQQIIRC